MTNLIGLLFIAGVVVLQIFLSRGESKWPGLVMPGISFLVALLYPLGMVAYAGGSTADFIVQMAVVWLLANIPTVVLLAIWFACREKRRRKKQLDKMDIQDLT